VNLAKTKNKKLRSSKLEEQGRRIKDLVMNYYGMWSLWQMGKNCG